MAQGRFKQTVTDSSFHAWTKFYKQDSNAINAIVSYYTKGAVIAFALDMHLRNSTSGNHSLDDLMRVLWNNFGRDEKGVEEAEIQEAIKLLTGTDETDFFEQYLRSTQEISLEELLAPIGFGIRLRQAANANDFGGYVDYEKLADKSNGNSLTLGLRLKKGLLEVFDVLNGSPAEMAGICPDDELLAINNRKLSAQGFEESVGQLTPGESCTLHLFRRGRLIETSIIPEMKPENVCDLYLIPDDDLSEQQILMRKQWSASSQLGNE